MSEPTKRDEAEFIEYKARCCEAKELVVLRAERDELREALRIITNLVEQVVGASPVRLAVTARVLERARAVLEKTKP